MRGRRDPRSLRLRDTANAVPEATATVAPESSEAAIPEPVTTATLEPAPALGQTANEDVAVD